VADKGYHSRAVLKTLDRRGVEDAHRRAQAAELFTLAGGAKPIPSALIGTLIIQIIPGKIVGKLVALDRDITTSR
jgi:hypothetical protein